MMIHLPIFGFVTFAICTVSTTGSDPCSNHMVLFDVRGLRSNHSLPGDSPICDRDIASGWYRVSSPAGGDMFNRCPESETCSTIFPVWMNGNVPPADNQIHSRTAYVRMGGNCRAMNIGIEVKNCSSYTVYHLTNTPGCPMAFCFGHQAPCPPDSQSPTGWEPYCDTGPLFLNQTPTVNFTVKRIYTNQTGLGKEVVFLCVLPDLASIHEQHEDITFLVRWFINGSQHVTAEKEVSWKDMPHELHEEDWSPGGARKFGITFRCAVRLRLGPAYSSSRESDPFFAGFRVNPTVLDLKEGETSAISVVPTVPVLSTSSYYRLQIEVIIPSKPRTGCDVQGWETANLVAGDRCGVEIQSIVDEDFEDSFRENSDNPATMNITASLNGIKDSELPRLMHVRMKADGTFIHKVWANVTLPSVLVQISDTTQTPQRPPTCWSNNDPHMMTFDGCPYENHRHGEFILFRHKTLPIQVNTFYTQCYDRSIPSCNCAVSVKSGADVFIVDVCPKPVSSNPKRIGFWSCLDHSLVVEQSGNGDYIVTLPTGGVVFIRWIYGTRISSVSVMASVLDYGLTEGLCGNYNGDNTDDFVHQGSKRTLPERCPQFHLFNTRETDEFSRSWSVNQTDPSSLWNPKIQDIGEGQQSYCQCTSNGTFPSSAECGILKKIDKCVRWGRDVSQNNEKGCKIKGSAFSSSSVLDTDFGSMEAPPFEYPDFEYSEPEWKNGWTEEKAFRHCNTSILGGPGGQQCSRLGNVSYDEIIRECVRDILLSGDDEWLKDSRNNMLGACKTRLLTDITLWNDTKPPSDIMRYLCPSECNGNGRCEDGECQCDPGFSADDCSINLESPPVNLVMVSGGLCDIQRRPCRATPVFGENFLDSEQLTCRVEILQLTTSGLEQVSEEQTKGLYMNFAEVMCPFFSNTGPAARLMSATPNTSRIATVYRVAVTNNLASYSDPLSIVAFDGGCLNCSVNPATCTVKENRCYIHGRCIGTGEIHNEDQCLICDPLQDLYAWTNKEGCPITVEAPRGHTPWTIIISCVTVGLLVIAGVVIYLVLRSWKPPKKILATTGMPMKHDAQ